MRPHLTVKMECRDLQRCCVKLLFLTVLSLTGCRGVAGIEGSNMDETMGTTSDMMLPQPTYCPPEYLYCFANEVCIHKEDGSCLPECEPHESLHPTADGHYTCEAWDSNSGQGDDDDDHWFDPDCYYDDHCVQCRVDEVYCMATDTCVKPDGSCSTSDDENGEDECGDGYELCHDWSDSMSTWSSYCAPIGTNCGEYHDECADGTCSWCPEGQVFCFASEQCCNPDGSCPCTDMQEECWSTGSKACVPLGECPMNRVRVKFSGKLVQYVGDIWMKKALERHIIDQFRSRFPAMLAQFDGGQLDSGLMYFDLWSSLSVEVLQGILEEIMADTMILTDLDSNAIQVVNFVVVPCPDSQCYLGEVETSCHTDIETWCPTVSLCLPADETVVCPEGPVPDVFYIQIKLAAQGVFNTCKGRWGYLHVMRDRLHGIGRQIQTQLVKYVQDLAVRVEHVYVQPRNTATDNLVVIVELHADPDTITVANVTDYGFELNGYWFDYYHINIEDGTTVVMVAADSEWTFVFPSLLLEGAENHVNLSLALPEDVWLEPITVDCSQKSQLIQIKPEGGEFGDEATVIPLSQMIYAKHTVTSFTNIKCALKSADSVVQANIRFLATEIEENRIEEISGVTLREESLPLVMEEDSGCHNLPEDIFIFHDEKEDLFQALNNWLQAMAGTKEHWVNAGSAMEQILTDMRNVHMEAIKRSKATVDLVPNSAGDNPSVTLKYRGEFLEQGFKTNVFSCEQLLTICPKPNVDEDFKLKITPHLTTLADPVIQAEDLIIPVKVLPVNDRPTARRQRRGFDHSLSPGVASLTFPRPPRTDLGDAPYAVPEFDVCEIARELFYDIDTTEDLGLAVLGFKAATVEGTWTTSASGTAEASILEFNPVTGAVSPAFLLECPGNWLKFTPTEDYKDIPWMASDSPRLVLLGWDMTNLEQLGDNRTIDVHLKSCPENTDKWCVMGEDTSLSAMAVSVPLVRRGCDDVPKSGLHMEVCGCGLPDPATCADCNGEPNGGAVLDSCNRCVGGNTGRPLEVCETGDCVPDCSDAECLEANTLLCESQEELQEILDNICPDGEAINPDWDLKICPLECIPETQVGDECFMCGEDICVDCSGTRNGNMIENLCGDCVEPAGIAESKKTSKVAVPAMDCNIGPFKPMFVFNGPLVNITAVATEGLIPDATRAAELTCLMAAVPGTTNTTNIVAPTILGVPVYNFDQRTITLTTSVPRASLQDAVGKYSVSCELSGEVIPGSSETITRVGHPTLTSISPAMVMYNELPSTITTITGTNFVDTGVVRCVVHCDDKDMDLGPCKHGLPGRWVSQDQVKCGMKGMALFRKAGVYRINVVLDWPRRVDMGSLPDPMEFTVRVPAPKVEGDEALLDPYGCKVLKVHFNMAVSGLLTTSCADYFTNSELANASCTIIQRRTLVVFYKTEIAAGTELTFKDGVIKHAESDSDFADTVTGTVTVVDQTPESLPEVGIQKTPATVGCKPVVLKTYTKNKGCFEVAREWMVDVSVVPDAALQANLDSLNTALAGKEYFYLKAEQLMNGVAYTFTLTWSVGNGRYTGTSSVTLTKDMSAVATAEIVRPNNLENVDPAKQLKLEAKVAGCLNTLESMEKSWSVAGPTIHNNLNPGSRSTIPKDTLKYGSTYTATFTVTLDAVVISAEKTFTTGEKSLEAAVLHMEDYSSEVIERRSTDDVELSCINKAHIGSSDDEEDVFCIWMCQDNYRGESETDFGPCLDDSGQLMVKRGRVITLEASGRKERIDRDTKQIWTLIMKYTKTQKSSSTNRTVVFKSVAYEDIGLADLVYPEIYLKSEEFIYVTTEMKMLTVRAYCKSATGYRWEGNNDDEEGYGPLKLTGDNVHGQLERRIRRDTEKYVSCGIRINLERINNDGLGLLPGEIYSFRLKLINRLSATFFFSKTQTVQIMMVSAPTAGTIHIPASDDTIVAMTTEFDIVLLDWYDDVDGYELSCDIIYTDESGHWEYANVLPVTPYRGVTEFTLNEGVFDFEATCCNSFDMCATAYMDSPVTVDPFEDHNIITVVSAFSIKLKMNPESLLYMVEALFKAVEEAQTASQEEKKTANGQLKSAASREVTTLVETGITSESVEEKSDALESSRLIMMEIVKGDSFGSETEYTFRIAVIDLVQTATGRGSEAARKKRSTTQSPGPGFTESQAVNALETYILLVDDPTSLSEEEALEMGDIVDGVMIAICIKQPEVGSVMIADTSYADVRVHTMTMNGTASTEFDVGCDSCTHNPAKVVYGGDIETAYGSSWNSSIWIIDDICVASAQIAVDYLTPTSTIASASPVSDIVILKMINPINYDTEVHDSLSDPAVITITIDNNATLVNETKYDYKCKLWMSEMWSDDVCTAAPPDMVGDVYKVVCSCTALGPVGIFQVLKPEDVEETTTTSAPTTTTLPPTTTPAPSLSLSTATERLDCQFAFQENYNSVADKTATKISLKNQLVTMTGFTANNIKELQIARGSIIVTFELHSTGQLTLGEMGYVVQTLIADPSTSFTDSNGGALTIIPGSFNYKEMKDEGDDDKKTDILPYIIGGTIGGLAIIGWIIVVVVLILKKQNNHKTGPAEHQPQALPPTAPMPGQQQIGYMPSLPTIPNYQLAPPPPYMYEPPEVAPVFPSNKTGHQVTPMPPSNNVVPMSPSNKVAPMTPSKSAKWEEVNEMKADGEQEKERPSGSRDNSNLSKDTNLESNRDEKAPTPVGE